MPERVRILCDDEHRGAYGDHHGRQVTIKVFLYGEELDDDAGPHGRLTAIGGGWFVDQGLEYAPRPRVQRLDGNVRDVSRVRLRCKFCKFSLPILNANMVMLLDQWRASGRSKIWVTDLVPRRP